MKREPSVRQQNCQAGTLFTPLGVIAAGIRTREASPAVNFRADVLSTPAARWRDPGKRSRCGCGSPGRGGSGRAGRAAGRRRSGGAFPLR